MTHPHPHPEPLTALYVEVLEFERVPWAAQGRKETAIHERFDWLPTRYYQVLNHVLDQPAAMAYDPQLVGRLRRIRDARARYRTGRRLGFDADDHGGSR